MKTIAVTNFKGGVGKTTVSLNLANTLARRGKRILLIDLDPQGTLSSWICDPEDRPVVELAVAARKSIANVLVPKELNDDSEPGLADVTFPTAIEGIHIVPAYETLTYAKDGILSYPQALAFAIKDLEDALDEAGEPLYDFIILDVSPTLDIKATNAYVAADKLIFPVTADGSVHRSLLTTINALNQTIKAMHLDKPDPFRVLRSRVKEGTIRDRKCQEFLTEALGDELVFPCCIHDSVKVGEATMPDPDDLERQPKVLTDFIPANANNRVLEDFEQLADEVLAWA